MRISFIVAYIVSAILVFLVIGFVLIVIVWLSNIDGPQDTEQGGIFEGKTREEVLSFYGAIRAHNLIPHRDAIEVNRNLNSRLRLR